jgi:hypothetical protein
MHSRDGRFAEGSGQDSEQNLNSNQTSFDVTSDDSAMSAELGQQTHSRMFDLPG